MDTENIADTNALRAALAAAPEPLAFYEAETKDAIGRHDFEVLRRLINVGEDFADAHIQQWRAFSAGLLALEDERQIHKAITVWEALRAQPDALAPGLLGNVLNGLGVAYMANEQWDRALRAYQDCLTLYEATQDIRQIPIVLLNLAVLHQKGQDPAAAQQCCQRSIAFLQSEEETAQQQIILAAVLNQEGLALLAQRIFDVAKANFARAFEIWTTQGDVWGQGIACDNLADVSKHLGNFDEAEAYYRRGRQLSEQAGNRYQVAQATFSLATLKLDTHAPPDEIEGLLNESLLLATAANNYEIITGIHLSRAQLQDRLGHAEQALDDNRRAVETVESLRANIVLPEDRARMTGARTQAYAGLVERLVRAATPEKQAEAFQYIEMAKSRTLVEMLAGRPLRKPEQLPGEWLEAESQLRQKLNALYQHNNDEVSLQEIARYERELAELRERIRVQNAEFDSFQTVAPLSLEAVQARLPAGSLMLEYFTLGDDILVFAITRSAFTVQRLPLRLRDLERAFTSLHESAYGPLRHMLPDADGRLRAPWILGKLYQGLIEPIENWVKQAQLLCIVPHGLLHYVPFHALQRTAIGQPSYLMGDLDAPLPIVYAPSATVLLDYCQHKPASAHTGCLSLGFNGQRLAQAEREAALVAQAVRGRALVGEQATRQALFEVAASYRYVHLACHGWFNSVWPMASGVLLADGALDVADVLRELRLDAELVSLSACETGRSRILQGDELIGLSRAFLYAGAPSVLVSHWIVDDLSSRLLMETFYRELMQASADDAPARHARALCQAQNTLRNMNAEEIRERLLGEGFTSAEVDQQMQHLLQTTDLVNSAKPFAHPYFWAPFFLVGDRL